jgi:hypothetical protein
LRHITSQLNQRLATHEAKFDDMIRHRDYMFECLMGEIQALKSSTTQAPSFPPPSRHTPPFKPRHQYHPSSTHHQQDISSHHRPYWYPPLSPYSNSSHYLQPGSDTNCHTPNWNWSVIWGNWVNYLMEMRIFNVLWINWMNKKSNH